MKINTNETINISSINSFKNKFINASSLTKLQKRYIKNTISSVMLNEMTWGEWLLQLNCNGITPRQSSDYVYETYGIVIFH